MIFCNTLIFKERNLKNLAKENKETEQKSIVLRKEDSIKNVACWPLRLIFCICFTNEPQKNKQKEFTTKFSYPCHLLCKVFLKESYVSVFGLDYLLCFVLFSSHMAIQRKYPLNSTGRLSLSMYYGFYWKIKFLVQGGWRCIILHYYTKFALSFSLIV